MLLGACGAEANEGTLSRDMAQTPDQAVEADMSGSPEPDLSPADLGGSDLGDAQDAAPDLDAQPDAAMEPVGCGADHPKVGWTAKLTTRQHGVSGDAVIVDNCTVEVRDFKDDGQGIDVRVYGATGQTTRTAGS